MEGHRNRGTRQSVNDEVLQGNSRGLFDLTGGLGVRRFREILLSLDSSGRRHLLTRMIVYPVFVLVGLLSAARGDWIFGLGIVVASLLLWRWYINSTWHQVRGRHRPNPLPDDPPAD